jgi:hypothetical protein
MRKPHGQDCTDRDATRCLINGFRQIDSQFVPGRPPHPPAGRSRYCLRLAGSPSAGVGPARPGWRKRRLRSTLSPKGERVVNSNYLPPRPLGGRHGHCTHDRGPFLPACETKAGAGLCACCTTPRRLIRSAFTCLSLRKTEKPQTKANYAYVCAPLLFALKSSRIIARICTRERWSSQNRDGF